MAKIRPQQNSLYGFPSPLQSNLLPPIIATRNPTPQDTGYNLGQNWVNKSAGSAYILAQVSGGLAVWEPVGGGTVALQTLTGNTGGAISPTAGNINVVGSGELEVAGAGSTLTISNNNYINATLTTTNATPTTIFTLPLGSTAAAYSIDVDFVCRNVTDGGGAAYNIFGLVTTNGTTATEVGQEGYISLESSTLKVAEATLTVSGNNAVLVVYGVTAKTVNWRVVGFYRSVS
jgi:hypothetical protein